MVINDCVLLAIYVLSVVKFIIHSFYVIPSRGWFYDTNEFPFLGNIFESDHKNPPTRKKSLKFLETSWIFRVMNTFSKS
jgi:hypothetical protein